MPRGNAKRRQRLDKAARAGWLYYVAGNTQEEIAQKLNVSRQSAHRLVSMAVSEKLVKIHIDHPFAHCLELKERISERFDLRMCEIVPSDPTAPNLINGIATAGAAEIIHELGSPDPKVIAFGTGRTLRACVEHIPHMDCPQHRLVSMVGNMHFDGSATPYSIVARLAEKARAQHYPMPVTVLVRDPTDVAILHKQEPVSCTLELCAAAEVTYLGIGHISESAPLCLDGFITSEECRDMLRAGAVGEIVGWVYDETGKLVPGLTNDRVTSAPLLTGNAKSVIGVAAGDVKVSAILGALKGRLIDGLITDELTAEALLLRG